MQTGDIVIVLFPFADLLSYKARPAVVVAETDDIYKDVIVSLISSVVPENLSSQQILIQPSSANNLKKSSVIKVSRLVTIEREKIIAIIGKLAATELELFKVKFKLLVES